MGVEMTRRQRFNPPGFDQTGVGFDQVVRDVPARQVQHGVPGDLQPLRWGAPPRPLGTDGHHGEFGTGAALAGRGRVPRVPLGAQQDVLGHG